MLKIVWGQRIFYSCKVYKFILDETRRVLNLSIGENLKNSTRKKYERDKFLITLILSNNSRHFQRYLFCSGCVFCVFCFVLHAPYKGTFRSSPKTSKRLIGLNCHLLRNTYISNPRSLISISIMSDQVPVALLNRSLHSKL